MGQTVVGDAKVRGSYEPELRGYWERRGLPFFWGGFMTAGRGLQSEGEMEEWRALGALVRGKREGRASRKTVPPLKFPYAHWL